MRGKQRTIASVLAEHLSTRRGADSAAVAAALAEACGPRLTREVSCRGVLRDGRLLVLVSDQAWADQVRTLEREVCARVNARLGRTAVQGLEIRVGADRA
jgi:predicted nucleic acid-binding Zn ribbon protein